MEPLYICVRSTLPWHDEAAVAAALVPELRAPVELWNATFDLRYAAFRVRLIEIAQRESGAAIENAKLTRFEEMPPGALVVPVDDDDWFSPELAQPAARGSGSPTRTATTGTATSSSRRGAQRRWLVDPPAARARHQPAHLRERTTTRSANLPELRTAITNHVLGERVLRRERRAA